MLKILKTKAFLIHKRPFLEKKVWYTFFTEQLGRIATLKTLTKNKPPYEQFQLYDIDCVEKNGSWQIKAIEPCRFIPPPSIKNLWIGLYYNELLYRLYQDHIKCTMIFNLYHEHIIHFYKPSFPTINIRYFEYTLQNQLGYGIDFEVLEQSNDDWYFFDIDHGLRASTTAYNRYYARKTLMLLAADRFDDPSVGKLIKHMFAKIIEHSLGEKALFIKNIIPQNHRSETKS